MRMGARSVLIGGFLPFRTQRRLECATLPQCLLQPRSKYRAGADLPGALAHARQPPVSIASRIQELRVDALSIIPDTHPEQAFAVSDLRFDFGCLCVPERILQRFARNAVHVVAKDWMQFPRCTLHGNAQRRRAATTPKDAAGLFTKSGDSLG